MAKQWSLNAGYSEVGIKTRQYSLATVLTSCWSFGSFEERSWIWVVWRVSWGSTHALDDRPLCWLTLQALVKSKVSLFCVAEAHKLDSAATELYVHRVLPILVGSGRLQPPLSHFYHQSGMFYYHSQGVKSATFDAIQQYFRQSLTTTHVILGRTLVHSLLRLRSIDRLL